MIIWWPRAWIIDIDTILSQIIFSLLFDILQIYVTSQTDRQIHNLETELSKLRLLHNKGKDRLREMEREITHYQTVSD